MQGDNGQGLPATEPVEPPGVYLDAAVESHLLDRIRRSFGLSGRFLRGVEARATARGRFPPCLPRDAFRCTRQDCLRRRVPVAGRWTVYQCHESLSMALLPIEMPAGEDLALHVGPFLLEARERRLCLFDDALLAGVPVLRDPEQGELALIGEFIMDHLERQRLQASLERREAALQAAVSTAQVRSADESQTEVLQRLVRLAVEVSDSAAGVYVEPSGGRMKVRGAVGDPRLEAADLSTPGGPFPFHWVIEHGASLHQPAEESFPERFFVPVGPRQRPRGCLVLVATPGESMGVPQRRLAEGVASQIARAVDSARYEHRSRHRLSNLEALHRIEEQIHGTLDLVDVIETALGVLDSSFLGRAHSLLLLGDGSRDLHVREHEGRYRVVQDFHYESDPGAWVEALESTSPQAVHPDPVRGARSGYFPEGSTEALACLLGPAHKPVAVMLLALDRPSSERDRQMLKLVAMPVAQALKNAVLFEKGERQIAELSLINEMGKALSSTLDLDDVLTYVLDMIGSILEADRGSLMLLDPESEELYVEVGLGITEAGRSRRIPLGEGIAGYVAASQQAILCEDTCEDVRYHHYSARGLPLTLISSPITCKGKVLGVINLERPLERSKSFDDEDLELLTTLASQAGIAIENASLYKDLLTVYFDTIRSLATALEAKDTYTHGHSRRVAKDSVRIARRLGLPRKQLETIRHGALLHDIGKIGIRESILFKAGPLDPEERAHIQSHPVLGANIIASIDHLRDVRDIIRNHHERWDGCGFPDCLAGEDIPLGARIVCIADAFDAMITSRPYREGIPISRALAILQEERGRQFDPQLVDIFLDVIHALHPALEAAPTRRRAGDEERSGRVSSA